MNEINLLLRIYSNERSDEGLASLKKLIAAAEDVQLEVFAGGTKQRI